MTDTELLDEIRRIINERANTRAEKLSAEGRDLRRYDRIVGLVQRHERFTRSSSKPEPKA